MKKLMIVAAAAAMVGVAFGECEEIKCAQAGRVKLSGKSCYAKEKAGDASKCEEGSCWLKPGTLRIAGYFYGISEQEGEEGCESCACQADFTANSIFWNEHKKQVVLTPALDLFYFLRNGGDKKKAAVGFTLSGQTGSIYCAGFGKVSYKTYAGGLLKSANGFFAGTMDAPLCSSYDEQTCEESTVVAKAFAPCELGEFEPEKVPAYGRWSYTYKADKVAKIEKDGNFDCLYPTGFKAVEE